MAAIAATDISKLKLLDLNIKNLPQEFLREEVWAKKKDKFLLRPDLPPRSDTSVMS
jgi:hypothetical protein